MGDSPGGRLSDEELGALTASLARLRGEELSTPRFARLNAVVASLWPSTSSQADVPLMQAPTPASPPSPAGATGSTASSPAAVASATSAPPSPSDSSLPFCASILNQGLYRRMSANTALPVPFKNELFEGCALLMVRTDLETQNYAHRFAGNHYTFEVQVQGKFTRVPPGRVFIGAEITKSMSLGLLTKGMCRAILQVGRSVNRHLHHSFGEDGSSEDDERRELPHIVGPMWSAVDRLVVSKGSDTVPPLGEAFPEEPVSRAARRKNSDFNLPFELDATYSLSFKTSNIDLLKWTATNLPLVSNIDLHTFWSDADLRTVCYCVVDPAESSTLVGADAQDATTLSAAGDAGNQRLSTTSRNSWSASRNPQPAHPKRHRQKDVSYIFSVLLQHESNHALDSLFAVTRSSPGSPRPKPPITGRRYSGAALLPYAVEDEDEDDGEGEGEVEGEDEGLALDEDSLFFDALDGESSLAASATRSCAEPGKPEPTSASSSSAIISLAQVMPSVAAGHSSTTAPVKDNLRTTFSGGPAVANPYCVAAAIEVDEMRLVRQSMGQKGRRTLYAFSVGSLLDGRAYSLTGGASTAGATGQVKALQCVLRTYNEWAKVFPIIKSSRGRSRGRMSDTEKRRIDLEHSFRIAVREIVDDSSARAKLESFLVGGEHTTAFLTTTPGIGLGVSAKRLRPDLPNFRLESLVIVQCGNHFWSEEFMGLTTEELVFIKPPNRLGIPSRLSVRLESILSVDKVEEMELPFVIAGCAAMMVSTFSRQYLILMRGSSFRNAWVGTLEVIIAQNKQLATPHIDLLVRPKGWKLGQRAVLNVRAFECSSRVTQSRSEDLALLAQYIDAPHILVARLLNMVLMLADQSDSSEDSLFGSGGGGPNEELQNNYVNFMNGVALLQCLELPASQTEEERTCLFLNLFHCMLLHGFLVVGVPNTQFKWTTFYNSCAYEAFGDVFTLSELQQHIVLCGLPASSPTVVSGDKDRYDFSLDSRDPRLLWALNCGRVASQPAVIPIYEPVSLYDQLDSMVTLSLTKNQVIVTTADDNNTTTVTVPRVCKTFLRAFELWGVVAELKPQAKVLAFLSHYSADGTEKAKLEQALDSDATIIKFAKTIDPDERHRFVKRLSNRLSISL